MDEFTNKLLFYVNIVGAGNLLLFLKYSHILQSDMDLLDNPLYMIKLYCCVVCLGNIVCALMFLDNKSKRQMLQPSKVAGSVALTVTSVIILHVITIQFGAPFFQSVSETFHFACLLACTTAVPCCLILGPSLKEWSRVFFQQSYATGVESCVFFTTWSSIIGAWFGAFPIPLDWDRPWQVWPISCVIGTLLGYSAGLVISSFYIAYQHWKLKKFKIV